MAETTTSDQDMNATLAVALGWKWYTFGDGWRNPRAIRWLDNPADRQVICGEGIDQATGDEELAGDWDRALPDYFGPAGSAELEDWLLANGWSIDTHQHEGWTSAYLSRKRERPQRGGVTEDVEGMTAAARRRCLALAAHAALCPPEVPRGD